MSLEMNSLLAEPMGDTINTHSGNVSYLTSGSSYDKHLEVEIMLCAFRNHYDQKIKWIEEVADFDDTTRTQEKLKILETYAQQLSEQNELLITTLADLQREASHRVAQMEKRLKNSAISTMEVVVHLHEYEQEIRRLVADKFCMEAALESTRHQLAAVRFENNYLRDQNNNLHHDVQGLLHIIQHARSTGHWEMDCVTFCELTPEQVFGPIHSMSQLESQESLYPHPSTSGDTEELWRHQNQSNPSCLSSHTSSASNICSQDKMNSGQHSAVDRMQHEFHHLYHLQEEAHHELLEKDRLVASLEFQLAELKHKLTLKEAESSCQVMEIKALKEEAKCLLNQDSGQCSWKRSAEVHFLTTPMILKSQSLPSVCYPNKWPSGKDELFLPSIKHCYDGKNALQEDYPLGAKSRRRRRKVVQDSSQTYSSKPVGGILRHTGSDPLPDSVNCVAAVYRCSSFTDSKTLPFVEPWFSDDRCKGLEPCHSMDIKEFSQHPDSFEASSHDLRPLYNQSELDDRTYVDDFQDGAEPNYRSFKGRSSTVKRTHINNNMDPNVQVLQPIDSLEVIENHLNSNGKIEKTSCSFSPTAAKYSSSEVNHTVPHDSSDGHCLCTPVLDNMAHLVAVKLRESGLGPYVHQDPVEKLKSDKLHSSSCDKNVHIKYQSNNFPSLLSVSTQTEAQNENSVSAANVIPVVNGNIISEDFDKNMQHLKEQVRRAEDKASSKEILIKQLQNHLQTTVKEVELKDKALENAERKLEAARQECATLRGQITALEEQVEQLHMELDDARVLHDNLTLNVEARKEQLEEMHQQESVLQEQKRLLMTQLDSQGDELLQTREELHSLKAQLEACTIQLEQQAVIIQNLQDALVQSKRALDETKKSTINSAHGSSNVNQLQTKNAFPLKNAIVDV